MKITKEGRFDIGHGYVCIISEMSDEMVWARVQFEFKGETYEYFDDDDDHLVPVSEIGEIETLPKPEGWAEDNEDFDQNAPVIRMEDYEGCIWVQRNKNGWVDVCED